MSGTYEPRESPVAGAIEAAMRVGETLPPGRYVVERPIRVPVVTIPEVSDRFGGSGRVVQER